MGFFSSKKITTVDTSVVRVINDDQIPNAISTGLNSAVFNNTSIAEEVIEAVIQGVAIKANRYYRYGQNKYTYGLPSGSYKTSVDGDKEVQAILNNLEGRLVALLYVELSRANYYHMAWDILFKSYNYVESSNEIRTMSQQKGVTVYLEDIEIVIPDPNIFEPEQLDLYGMAGTAGFTPVRARDTSRIITPFTINTSLVNPVLIIKYIFVVNGSLKQENITIPFPKYADDDYFHVKYSLPDAAQSINSFGVLTGTAPNISDDPIKYWTYKDNSGIYLDLDNVYNAPPVSGLFFPFVYFRYNKTPEKTSGTADSYVTSKAIADIVDLDFDKVTAAVNKNPDIKDVEQAMMIMAVPAKSNNKIEKEYLFDFFTRVHGADNDDILRGKFNIFGGLIIQDKRFKMALSSSSITKTLVSISGTVGDFYSGIGTTTEESVLNSTNNFSSILGISDNTDNGLSSFIGSNTATGSIINFGTSTVTTTTTRPPELGGGIIQTSQVVVNTASTSGLTSFIKPIFPSRTHFYQKQLTPFIREEIMVRELKMIYYVTDKYFVTADGVEPILLVPIDYSISRQYPLVKREELYSRSFHYVFNTKIVTKVKWYQSAFFSILLKFVGLVAFVYSLGTTSFISTALVAAGFTGAQVVILGLIINAAISLVVSAVLKVVVKALGLELSVLFALVAAYYGGKVTSLLSIESSFAGRFLAIVNGLIGAKQSLISEDLIGLADEYADFDLLKTKQDKELERANKLLESTNRLNPFIIFGESPEDYYNRTAHSGNIGVLSLDAISSFVEISLKLPTIDKTLGDELNGTTI